MNVRKNWKRLVLAGMLLVLLLGISGCFTKPDPVEEMPTDPVQVLPFATATPTPTPAPTDQSGWVSTDGPATAITPTPAPATPTPTIGLMTATPTPKPAWTYAPTATPKPTDDGTLRFGSSGQAVRNLQQKLKDLGYYSGSVDGDFGSGTETAVKAFQSASGLTADGVAGTRTLSALNSSNAKPAQATARPAATGSVYATNRPTPKSYTPSTLSKYKYLQLGSSGSDVTKLQNRLKELGYFKGTVNGNFGEDTQAAVEAFQKRNGLWVDGVAGEDTQRELFGSNALPAASGSSLNTGTAGTVAQVSGYRTLKSGLEGDDVSLLQTRLKELGYYSGDIDGKYGTSTATAVQLFQQVNGLTVDGAAGSSTQARIYGNSALYAPTTEAAVQARVATVDTMELGSTGEAVYSLQERLYDLGYYTGRIDGVYSDAVALAVRAFQTANKLTADGKAGKTTQTRIYADNAVPASAAASENIYATLRAGDSGERVRALQSLLETYAYYTGEINGIYDANTTSAVTQLQAGNGLTADGIAGPATLQLLYDGNPRQATAVRAELEQASQQVAETRYDTIKRGAEGVDVMMLQEFLAELGYYYGDQDGKFGAETLLAVQDFQQVNGLPADGVAGHETLALLFSAGAVASPSLEYAAAPQTPVRTTMREGDEGQDVYTMQERLQILGYLTGAPDGKYGAGTTAAVKAFQAKNGLKDDGVAGQATVTAMYAAGVVATGDAALAVQTIEVVSNRNRELEEQEATGAIQGSLAGGGIAASYGSGVYYAGKGGTLYRQYSGSDRQLYDGKTAYIHASDKGVTFASGNKILRVPTGGGNAATLATAGNLGKLSVIGDTLVYLDGGALVRQGAQGDAVTIAKDVKDFTVDVFQYVAYTATPSGVYSVGLNGSGAQLVTSVAADQVQLCDSVIFVRSGGNIYRVQDGITLLLMDADASWMGIYRDKVYYIVGKTLYRCGTDGSDNRLFYDGATAEVSFVAGNVYIAGTRGGAVTEIISAE